MEEMDGANVDVVGAREGVLVGTGVVGTDVGNEVGAGVVGIGVGAGVGADVGAGVGVNVDTETESTEADAMGESAESFLRDPVSPLQASPSTSAQQRP